MRTIVFTTLLLFSVVAIQAQNSKGLAEVKWGPELELPKGELKGTFHAGGNTVAIWADDNDLTLISLNDDLSEKKRVELDGDPGRLKGKFDLLKIFVLGDQIMILSKIKDKKGGRYVYYLRPINSSSLEFSREAKGIAESKFLSDPNLEHDDIRISQNEQFLMIAHPDATDDGGENWYEVSIINTELSEVFLDEIPFELGDIMEAKRLVSFGDGKFAFVLQHFEVNDFVEPYRLSKGYEIHWIDGAMRKANNIEIEEGKSLVDVYPFMQGDEKLFFGIYGDQGFDKASGWFKGKIGPRERFVEMEYQSIASDELTKYTYERAPWKKKTAAPKPNLSTILIYDLYTTADGYQLVGEIFWPDLSVEENYASADAAGASNTYKITCAYHFADVLIIDLDKGLKVKSLTRVPKNNFQRANYVTQNDEWAREMGREFFEFRSMDANSAAESFLYAKAGGKWAFMFNDNVNNHKSFDAGNVKNTPEEGEELATSGAVVNGSKNSRDYFYTTNEEESLYQKTRRGTAIKGKLSFVFVTSQKKTIKAGRIDFK